MGVAEPPNRTKHSPLSAVLPRRPASGGRRVRLGMVGGGEATFMGAVHRIAARLDDHYTLVAGALSPPLGHAVHSAHALGAVRHYADYLTMAREEAARPDGIEVVSIVAPDPQRVQMATEFLQAGIHVICDRPMTGTLAEAQRLRSLMQRSGRLFAVTQNHAGCAMVRQARRLALDGALGDIRVAQVEYPSDGPSDRADGAPGAGMGRTEAGAGHHMGDMCSHAFDLLHYMTGLTAVELCAPPRTFLAGGGDGPNTPVMLQLANGAHGMLWASTQAATDGGLRVRIYGSLGAVEWTQEYPDQLSHAPLGQPAGSASLGDAAARADGPRIASSATAGAEGFLEAFATLYAEIAQTIRAGRGGAALPHEVDFPTLDDAIHRLAFDDAVRRSSADGGCWVCL